MTTIDSTPSGPHWPQPATRRRLRAVADRGAPRARRWLQKGRASAVAIVVASVCVVAALEPLTAAACARVVVFAGSWMLGVHAVEHALNRIRVVAGHIGIALLGALGGFAIASGASLWLLQNTHQLRLELVLVGFLALIALYGEAWLKARVAELRPRVLLVGGGSGTQDALDVVARDGENFAVVGIVAEEGPPRQIRGVPVVGQLDMLGAAIEEMRPDLVVVAVERGRPEVFAQLADAARLGFRVVGLPEFFEHAFGRVPIRSVTNAWFMSVLHLYQRPYARSLKRGFDLTVGVCGIVLTLPLFGLISLLILRTGRPIFYRQTRLGEHGKHFTIYKFRTMRPDAEAAGAVWASEGDPRTTRVGSILRRTRVDELPQLINVLRGEMAIVGPRPERPEFVDFLERAVPFWSRRHLLKPGVTGWAQIRADYAADALATEEKLAYDLWYLRHRSLVVDTFICVRTLVSLLLVQGR